MSTELTIPPSSGLMSLIVETLRNPEIDAAKLEVLLQMQHRLNTEAETDAKVAAFNTALRACQSEIAPIVRNVENSQTKKKFADLAQVDAITRPIYLKHNLTLSFDEEIHSTAAGGVMVICCDVTHSLGHTKRYRLVAAPDTLGAKGAPTKTELWGRASSITFLRRYLEFNIFNIVLKDHDDDGQRAGMTPLSPAQVEELVELLRQTDTSEGSILQHYFAGEILRLEDVGSGWFLPMKAALTKKLTRLAGKT